MILIDGRLCRSATKRTLPLNWPAWWLDHTLRANKHYEDSNGGTSGCPVGLYRRPSLRGKYKHRKLFFSNRSAFRRGGRRYLNPAVKKATSRADGGHNIHGNDSNVERGLARRNSIPASKSNPRIITHSANPHSPVSLPPSFHLLI